MEIEKPLATDASVQPPTVKKARKRTDESLNVERGKTDESLGRHSEQAEDETDKALRKRRMSANQAGQLNQANDQNVKSAIEHERQTKQNQLASLLEQREVTDKNLHQERSKTDVQVELSIEKLSLEQELHVNTKAELTTRDEFLAIVSHDLRNPVGAISACAQLLLKDIESLKLNAQVRPLIELIQRNADLSIRLISDILDMEKIVEGKWKLIMADTSVDQLIQETVENFSPLVRAKKITLSIAQPVLKLRLRCDKDRISQVLSNLIGNAIKFTPEGGKISVQTEMAESDFKISVSDTGRGIPKEKQTQIFDRYTQLSDQKRQGLGLGLYIAKGLIEMHHGKLGVNSTPGQGSTFWITLPSAL